MQWCPVCKYLVTAALVEGYSRGMRVSETSTCVCGLLLWDWRMGEGLVTYCGRSIAPTPPPVPQKKSREQLRLF